MPVIVEVTTAAILTGAVTQVPIPFGALTSEVQETTCTITGIRVTPQTAGVIVTDFDVEIWDRDKSSWTTMTDEIGLVLRAEGVDGSLFETGLCIKFINYSGAGTIWVRIKTNAPASATVYLVQLELEPVG